VSGHRQRLKDLIGSGYEPHTPVPEADILPLVFDFELKYIIIEFNLRTKTIDRRTSLVIQLSRSFDRFAPKLDNFKCCK